MALHSIKQKNVLSKLQEGGTLRTRLRFKPRPLKGSFSSVTKPVVSRKGRELKFPDLSLQQRLAAVQTLKPRFATQRISLPSTKEDRLVHGGKVERKLKKERRRLEKQGIAGIVGPTPKIFPGTKEEVAPGFITRTVVQTGGETQTRLKTLNSFRFRLRSNQLQRFNKMSFRDKIVNFPSVKLSPAQAQTAGAFTTTSATRQKRLFRDRTTKRERILRFPSQ